jgi:N,N'-diacetyllegionaminate synthase
MDFEARSFSFEVGEPTRVIAEIGVNHNGEPAIARRMVDAAIAAGADIIKFQAFVSEKEISRYAPKTPYQRETTTEQGNQLEMCKALELKPETLREMKNYCVERQTPFLCAAFDFDSVDLLVDDLKVSTIKIPSGEITNVPLLQYIGSRRKAAILSTGASTLVEVGRAIDALQTAGCPEIALFHCVSSYPAPFEQVNLKVMRTLKDAFRLPVGFSDHTVGTEAAVAAAALGACAIEKHFTLDKTMEGPDHRASVEPHELAALVQGVRIAHSVLGDGIKRPVPCEIENLPLIRKSLVAARRLSKGTHLGREMIEIKRPEGGIAPGDLGKIIGLTLTHDLEPDQPITWDCLV